MKPLTGDVLVRQVREWFMTESWLQQKFHSSKVAIAESWQVLFPAAFQSPELVESLCRFSFHLEGDVQFQTDELAEKTIANAWCAPTDLLDVLKEMLGQHQVCHASSGFLNAAMKMNEANKSPGNFLAVNVFINQLELALFKNGKLVFQNLFDFETPEDFTYYILMVCENFQLNPEKLNVKLFGDVEQEAGYCEMACTYLGNLSFGSRPSNYQYARELSQVPEHTFFGLYNLFK